MICAFCSCPFGSNRPLIIVADVVSGQEQLPDPADRNGKSVMALTLGERLGLSAVKDSRSLLAAMCINAFGAGMFFPFALLYYQAATSLSVATIGLALTGATLVTLAVTPITGALVDRFGARRLVVASQCVEAAGFIAYLAVSSVSSLFAAALLATAGTRMFYASFSTLIAESVEGAERDRLYGLVGITQSVGASASGFLASLVIGAAGIAGFRAVILGNACCLVATAVLIHRQDVRKIPEPREKNEHGYLAVLRDRPFLKVVGGNALFILCSMLLGVALAVYATEAMHAPLWAVGVTGLLQTGLVVGVQTAVIRRIQPYRRTRAMLIAGCLWIVACLVFAAGVLIPPSVVVPYLMLAALTFTAAQLFYIPAARSLAANLGPASLRGRYIATYELSWGLAAAIVPAFFGVTYAVLPSAPWLLMCVIVAGAMGLLWWSERSIPIEKNRPAGQSGNPAGA